MNHRTPSILPLLALLAIVIIGLGVGLATLIWSGAGR